MLSKYLEQLTLYNDLQATSFLGHVASFSAVIQTRIQNGNLVMALS